MLDSNCGQQTRMLHMEYTDSNTKLKSKFLLHWFLWGIAEDHTTEMRANSLNFTNREVAISLQGFTEHSSSTISSPAIHQSMAYCLVRFSGSLSPITCAKFLKQQHSSLRQYCCCSTRGSWHLKLNPLVMKAWSDPHMYRGGNTSVLR